MTVAPVRSVYSEAIVSAKPSTPVRAQPRTEHRLVKLSIFNIGALRAVVDQLKAEPVKEPLRGSNGLRAEGKGSQLHSKKNITVALPHCRLLRAVLLCLPSHLGPRPAGPHWRAINASTSLGAEAAPLPDGSTQLGSKKNKEGSP